MNCVLCVSVSLCVAAADNADLRLNCFLPWFVLLINLLQRDNVKGSCVIIALNKNEIALNI